MANQTNQPAKWNILGTKFVIQGELLVNYGTGDGEFFVRSGLTPFKIFTSNKDKNFELELDEANAISLYSLISNGAISLVKGTRDDFLKEFKTADDFVRYAKGLSTLDGKNPLDEPRATLFNQNARQTGIRLGVPGVSQNPQPDGTNIDLGTISAEDFEIGTEVVGTADKTKVFGGQPLRYPTQIMDKKTDYLMIQVQEYARNKSTPTTPNKLVGIDLEPSTVSTIGSIILPIPSSIQDGNSVSYADGTLDSLSAAALQGVSNTIKDFNLMSGQTSSQLTQKFIQNLGNTFNTMMDAGLKGQFIRTLASQAISSIPGVSAITPDQFLARQTGGIMNPNMELLFNGVTLRSFKFSFKMTPRDEYEGGQIKQIIRNLKINMAPQTLEVGTANKNNFIRTPNVFKLSYMKGSGPHPFLHKFKICALTDMSVNYTGEGLYATYSDATPISIILDLTFKELEPIYDTDYFNNGELSDDTVGY